MNEFSERLLSDAPRRERTFRFGSVWLVIVPLLALLFQSYVRRFVPVLAYVELPLLVTVHFALSRRQPVASLFYGAVIGLVQDSLARQPIGIFGMTKTLVGYFAAQVSLRFAVENRVLTFLLSFFFYFFHEFFVWVLGRALLGELVNFDLQQTLLYGVLNAVIALFLFPILDKLK